LGLDEKLDIRAGVSMPDGFLVPFSTKRELLNHDLDSDVPRPGGLQTAFRPSDRFAMGRRDDMAIYFDTVQNYVVGGLGYSLVRELFSASCCEYTQTAEGQLCYQLTSHGMTPRVMYPDSELVDFF